MAGVGRICPFLRYTQTHERMGWIVCRESIGWQCHSRRVAGDQRVVFGKWFFRSRASAGACDGSISFRIDFGKQTNIGSFDFSSRANFGKQAFVRSWIDLKRIFSRSDEMGRFLLQSNKNDGFVKSPKTVMPDLIRHPEPF